MADTDPAAWLAELREHLDRVRDVDAPELLAEALDAFDDVLAERDARIRLLERILRRHPTDVEPTDDDFEDYLAMRVGAEIRLVRNRDHAA